MSEEIEPHYRLEIIHERHDISFFDCRNLNLNNFLQYRALTETRHELSRTYVLADLDKPPQRHVAGYFTLQADSKLFHNPIRDCDSSIPFIELTYLARDVEWSGQGIGPMLLMESLRRVVEVADKIGVFGVHLRPTREGMRLYQHFGFEVLRGLHGRLWMPIAQVRAIVQG